MVEATPCTGDGGCVRQHTHAAGNLGKVASRDMRGGLVADAELETGGTPIDELDCSLCLDDGNSGVDILRDDIATVEQSTSH